MQLINVAQAMRSTIPFSALDLTVAKVVRHPDAQTAELTVQIRTRNLDWLPGADGNNSARLIMAAASVKADQSNLASRLERVALASTVPDPKQEPDKVAQVKLTIRVPRNTKYVRVVAESEQGGRIGAADMDRKTIDAAPAMPKPQPQLALPPQAQEPPTTP